MDSYTKTLIQHMAKQTKTELTDRHLNILQFAYDYFLKTKRGPLPETLYRGVGADQKEVASLFPQGLSSIYTWLGIPTFGGASLCKNMVTVQVEDYREAYLDHAATTGIRSEVAEALRTFYERGAFHANPQSSHKAGKQAYEAVREARIAIANTLQVSPNEIIFTSGGSEAINLAIKGLAFEQLKLGGSKRHIVSSKVEHSAVLKSLSFLESLGFKITYLDVSNQGLVHPEKVKKAIAPETLLVSIMAVNNEIGTVSPLGEIGQICKQAQVPFFSDGVQAYGKIKLLPKEIGISLLSISGHKIHAPKGIGALYVDSSIKMNPLIHGGDQECGLRAGTENVEGIYAFGLAASLMDKEIEQDRERIANLRDYFLNGLKKCDINYILNGSLEHSIPHIVNIRFHGIDSGSLLLSLNKIGIYVSAGSACTAGQKENSHVIAALGVNTAKYGSVRFSFGKKTTKEEIDYLLKYLPQILIQMRK